jgi:hypothetical protein
MTCLKYPAPLTQDLSEVPCANHTRRVSSSLCNWSTQCHPYRTCLKYQVPLTQDLSELPCATNTQPVWSTRRHSHTSDGAYRLINFNLIYEDRCHWRYSSYLCIQRYCINVQAYLWSISVPNFTRLASMFHKESRNGNMKKLFSQNRYIVISYSTNVTQIQAACLPELSRRTLFQGPKEVSLVSPRVKSFQRPPCYYAMQYIKQYTVRRPPSQVLQK